MRACTKCGELKPLEAFPPVRRGEPKLQTWCRECFAEANARNYRKNHKRERSGSRRTDAAAEVQTQGSAAPPVQLTFEATLGIRTCRVCHETKPLGEFPYRSLRHQTRQWICLLCQRAYTNEWYSRNRKQQI